MKEKYLYHVIAWENKKEMAQFSKDFRSVKQAIKTFEKIANSNKYVMATLRKDIIYYQTRESEISTSSVILEF